VAIGAIGTTPTAPGSVLTPQRPQSSAPADAKGGFGETLSGLIESVDNAAGNANTAIARMVNGSGDVHEAMIALNQAQTTFELTVQVRNKLVQAYQDVMRMPI